MAEKLCVFDMGEEGGSGAPRNSTEGVIRVLTLKSKFFSERKISPR